MSRHSSPRGRLEESDPGADADGLSPRLLVHRLMKNPESLQSSNDKSAARQLVFDRRMRPDDAT
jgi:hypothetical protein